MQLGIPDRFNVPEHAKIDHPPRKTGYAAIAAVYDGDAKIGFAMFAVTDWVTRRAGKKFRRPMAEVLLVRPGDETAVPDDGLIGEDDPAYEAIGRGELVWSGRLFRIEWLEHSAAEQVYSQYFE